MKESNNATTCILGPSHIVRWQYLAKTTLTGLPKVDSYALPGLPIWDPELISFLKAAENEYEQIYVLVGDFRFGNEIFSAPHKKRHLAIKKENINNQNDKELLIKALEALDEIYKIKNVRFIFWDLYLREFINKRAGNYTENNIYQHPLWNYCFFQNRYSQKTVELSSLDDLNIDLLFVDSSLHPSILGYCFLYNLFSDQSVIDSYLSSLRLKGEIDKDLYYAHPSTIIGNGSFFRTVQLHITKGIISAFPNVLLSRADDALFAKRKETRTLFFFSESQNEDGVQKCLKYVENSNWAKNIHVELLLLKEKLSHEAMVEITDGRPSFLFIFSILHSSFNGRSIQEMDIDFYKERLNNLFRKNCKNLSSI
ncbi:hypothetical protein [Leclercia sp. Marseille-Q4284]|uniref:hypothetical protein n=1 Tax=Leclercia sp. Marseille-Q4284 TaxID=2866582 RepID=UPI001CE47556|nr:hypothetical protein [Leclercia sp. Marseille-Q4284]